jgi:hypothetical protein
MAVKVDITDSINSLSDAFDMAVSGSNEASNLDNNDDNITDDSDVFRTEPDAVTIQNEDPIDRNLGADIFDEPIRGEEGYEEPTPEVSEEEDEEQEISKDSDVETEDESSSDSDKKPSDSDTVDKESDDESDTEKVNKEIFEEGDELIKNPTVKVKTRNYVTKLINRVKELQDQVDGKASPEVSNEKVQELQKQLDDAYRENTVYRRKLQVEHHPFVEKKFNDEQSKLDSRIEKILLENGINRDETFEETDDGEKEELISLALIKKSGSIRNYFKENPDARNAILESLPEDDSYLARQLLSKQKEIDIEKQEYIESLASDDGKFGELSKMSTAELQKGIEESIEEFQANEFVKVVDISTIEDEDQRKQAEYNNSRSKNLINMYKQTLNDVAQGKADVAEIAQVATASYYFRDLLEGAIQKINEQTEIIKSLRTADSVRPSNRPAQAQQQRDRQNKAVNPLDASKLSLDHSFDAAMDNMFPED